MRFIVYGVGAIGGTIAAALALSGQEVALAGRMVREKLRPGAIVAGEIAAGLRQAANGNWRGD